MKTKVYLAASYSDKENMRHIRRLLVSNGYEVTSRWLNSPGNGLSQEEIATERARATNGAMLDIEDIMKSDIVIVFTGKASTTGGFHVEYGLGLGLNKIMVVVGPMLNVFMAIPYALHYESEEEFTQAIKERKLSI